MKTINKISVYTFMLVLLLISGCSKKNDADENKTGSLSEWSALGNMDLSNVYDLYADKTGNIYAVGAFMNGAGKRFVAKWDGSKWSEVGTLNVNDNILSICGDNNGNLYIGGLFTNSSGKHYVAKWNGSAWSDIGFAPWSDYILDLSSDANGNIYAACDTRVIKYDGTNWTVMKMDGYLHWANTVLVSNGNIYVGGGSYTAGTGGSVAKWNGNGWSEIGDLNTNEQVYTLCTDANGNLYAGGGFNSQSGYVVKWSGIGWTDLILNGNGVVKSICTDTNGNLYAGGSFYNESNEFYVAKWNGSKWADMGLNAYSGITKLVASNGKLYVGGSLAFILNSAHYVAVCKI